MGKDAKPQKQARPTRDRYGQPFYRSRHCDFAMDAFDEVIFSYALRDAYPGVRFESCGPNGEMVRDHETIAHCSYQVFVCVPIDYSATDDRPPGPKRSWRTEQSFQYLRSGWCFGNQVTSRWPFDFPYLEEGSLSTLWYLENPASLVAVRKVFRLLTRVTTSHVKSMYPGKNGHDITSSARHGHHALLWCAQKPDRIIGHRHRPADGWSVPQAKWYQDLWRRVIAAYGEDFADPALESSLVQFIGLENPFRHYPDGQGKPGRSI